MWKIKMKLYETSENLNQFSSKWRGIEKKSADVMFPFYIWSLHNIRITKYLGIMNIENMTDDFIFGNDIDWQKMLLHYK